jgi:hypothetical protein
MARSTINASQVNEDKLEDSDGDTLIQVEEGADEDKIRFDTAGTERLVINADGGMAFGNGSTAGAANSWNFFNFKGGGVRVTANNFYCDNDRGVLWGDSSVSVKGNATAGSESLTVRANYTAFIHVDGVNNAVGIGTTTPSALLHVEGNGVTIKSGSHSSYGSSLKFMNTGYSHATMGVSGSAFVIAETSAGNDQWSGVTPLLTVGLGADATGGGSGPTQGYVGIGTSTPGSGLTVAKSVSFPTGTLRTGAYTITEDDFCIVADCNSSAFTLTLPSATDAMAGRIYTIKRMDSGNSGGGNQLTISRNGKNIDNVAGDLVLANLDAVTLQCIGASGGWIRIGQFLAPVP